MRLGETELKFHFDPPPVVAQPVTLSSPPVPSPVSRGLSSKVDLNSLTLPPSTLSRPAPSLGSPQVPPVPPSLAPPGSGQAPRRASPQFEQASNAKIKFYAVVGVIVLVGAYFFNQNQIARKGRVQLRSSADIETSIVQSTNETEKTIEDISRKGLDTIQYKTAQEHYLRGFRDYRQGQFVRAMESFQAALSFFPQHELARKYYTLSKKRFDELAQFQMVQGKRYHGIKNYRLCMSAFSTVIKMKKDERDPVRREALQYYNECEVKMRGKY